MAVNYTAKGETFTAEKPRVWTETRLREVNLNGAAFDLAPDGKRLAAMIAGEGNAEKPQTHLTFLLHFSDELRRRSAGVK